MQATLIVVEPEMQPNEFKVTLPLTIGRGSDSTLKLSHALISRQHCELFEDQGRLMVRDLGSLNGTFVAGQKVETAILPSGELLTVGSVTFRAVYGEGAVLAPPTRVGADEEAELETVGIDETSQIAFKRELQAADEFSLSDDDTNDFFKRLN